MFVARKHMGKNPVTPAALTLQAYKRGKSMVLSDVLDTQIDLFNVLSAMKRPRKR